jgi:hypothetical protein
MIIKENKLLTPKYAWDLLQQVVEVMNQSCNGAPDSHIAVAFRDVISGLRGPDQDDMNSSLKHRTTAAIRDAIGLTVTSGLTCIPRDLDTVRAEMIKAVRDSIESDHFANHIVRAVGGIHKLQPANRTATQAREREQEAARRDNMYRKPFFDTPAWRK